MRQDDMGMDRSNGNQEDYGGTRLRGCHAEKCKYNSSGGECDFRHVEVGTDGRCVSYAERGREDIERYLKARGFGDVEIAKALEDAGYGGAD